MADPELTPRGDTQPAGPPARSHPLFIATIVGVPAVLVVVMGWYLYTHRWSKQPPVERPGAQVVIEGSQKEWADAQRKAQEARSQFQDAMARLRAAERGGELTDRTSHIRRFEEALASIRRALQFSERMMQEYATEQKKANPEIDEWALEERVASSRYGAKMSEWRLLERDIRHRLSTLR